MLLEPPKGEFESTFYCPLQSLNSEHNGSHSLLQEGIQLKFQREREIRWKWRMRIKLYDRKEKKKNLNRHDPQHDFTPFRIFKGLIHKESRSWWSSSQDSVPRHEPHHESQSVTSSRFPQHPHHNHLLQDVFHSSFSILCNLLSSLLLWFLLPDTVSLCIFSRSVNPIMSLELALISSPDKNWDKSEGVTHHVPRGTEWKKKRSVRLLEIKVFSVSYRIRKDLMKDDADGDEIKIRGWKMMLEKKGRKGESWLKKRQDSIKLNWSSLLEKTGKIIWKEMKV